PAALATAAPPSKSITRWSRALPLAALLALTGLLVSSAAWAARGPQAITVSGGTCWGNSVTFTVTVTSNGSGNGNATLGTPSGLPSGVTFVGYAGDAGVVSWTNTATQDSATLILQIGPTASAGSTNFTVHTSPLEAGTNQQGTVTIAAGPTFTGPTSQTVCAGSTATFSVSGAPAGSTYQWQRAGFDIGGATSSSYTTPATTGADNNAQFRVIVKTPCSAQTTSASATLTVNSNWTISASAGAGGSISPGGSVVVACGGNQAFSITPNSCFSIAAVTVDGSSVGAVSSYT